MNKASEEYEEMTKAVMNGERGWRRPVWGDEWFAEYKPARSYHIHPMMLKVNDIEGSHDGMSDEDMQATDWIKL